MNNSETLGVTILRRAVTTSLMVNLLVTVQLTVPLKGPEHDVSMGLLFYGGYSLPPTFNSTLSLPLEPYQIARRVQRNAVYFAIEHMFERVGGVAGRACLLRSICEAAAWPLQHDGLFGELLYLLLTPSSTLENGSLHPDYPAAEQLGRRSSSRGFCSTVFPACTSSPLDLISSLWTV